MKRFISLVLSITMIAVFALSLQSCGNTKIPDSCKNLNLNGFAEDYKSNSLRTENEYVGEWCEIVCTVQEIVSAKHFTMLSTHHKVYIDCWLKNKDFKDTLLDLDKGDEIKVYGIVRNIHSSASTFWDVNIKIDVYKIEVL